MNSLRLLTASMALGTVALSSAQVIGPSPYTSFADSPFAGTVFDYFHLEDFEDDFLNSPGLTSNSGTPGSSFGSGLVDSVDGDDGVFDGNGNAGESIWSSDLLVFDFSEVVLGQLPTHVGIVWTDGAGDITFSAYDAELNLVGTVTASHADGNFAGGTAEDRFYGMIHMGGIKRIILQNPGGIEADHVQYGAVPEPASLAMLGLGALALARRRRRA